MKIRLLILSLGTLAFSVQCLSASADNSTSKKSIDAPSDSDSSLEADSNPAPTLTPVPKPLPTPVPTQAPASKRTANRQNALRVLEIHKPMPNPAWGKVIQYHRSQIFALAEKNQETLHEFVFQDDDGIVRTATFHETASGDGYWEVWIWDQP
ncbi:MAG TPA: hypothetical protein VMV05_04370 [bacterium]|nr:hypothetical protein [bacterium]